MIFLTACRGVVALRAAPCTCGTELGGAKCVLTELGETKAVFDDFCRVGMT